MRFLPGECDTREVLSSIHSTYGTVGVTYIKSYIQPNNVPITLELTSDGIMRADGAEIFTAVGKSIGKSVTAFGREYIAVTDGSVGLDIPRWYDGTKWERFTMEGPGETPPCADAAATTFDIVNVVPLPPIPIVSITNGDGIVTVVTSIPHGLSVGDNVLITGNSVYQYNGQETIASVPNPTSFVYDTLASGLPEGTGGEVIPLDVTVTTTLPNGLIQGETITITGNSDNNYNNSIGGAVQAVGLASPPVCTFYPHNHAFAGAFEYDYPGDGYDINLPGPIATFTLGANDSITFNPNGSSAGTLLPGAPNSYNDQPMQIFGVTPGGIWDGTDAVIWSGATQNYCMIVIFNLQFSEAGTYTFQMVNDDGAIFGMGGGVVPVSGPTNNAQTQTKTALKGYPIVAVNNNSANHGAWNSQFSVSVPAAGTYPCELDYVQWEGQQTMVILSQPATGAGWLNTTAYAVGAVVNVGGQNYVALVANINQSPPNATYWATQAAFIPIPSASSAIYATPANWTVLDVINGTTFTFTAVYAVGTGLGGILTVGGLSTPGKHQVAMCWLLNDYTITRPSPPITFNSAGNTRWTLSDIPVGPPNVLGRVFIFTGAGGDNFFYFTAPPTENGQIVGTTTTLMDNVSTVFTVDLNDLTLFEGLTADQTGSDLFGQVNLGLVGGIASYSNRILVWNDTNYITNMLGLGFESGSTDGTYPKGWIITNSVNGAMFNGKNGFGFCWQTVGNGTDARLGWLVQDAFEDWEYEPIFDPLTPYTFQGMFTSGYGNVGQFTAELYSATGGVGNTPISLATAVIPCSLMTTTPQFLSVNFTSQTPAVMPDDTVFQIYWTGLANGQQVTVDEMMPIYTQEPVVAGQARFSYAINPGAFNDPTGSLVAEYPEYLRDTGIIRDNLYIQTLGHLVRTQDNGISEPLNWPLYTVGEQMRALSNRSFALGEGWGVVACEAGLMMFSGGEPVKISEEVQSLWSQIDPNLYSLVHVTNDATNRRVYINLPLKKYAPTNNIFSPAPASCNKCLLLDYHELNNSAAIINAPPLHISITGKMISSDLTRKWSVWNVQANSSALLVTGGNPIAQMAFGSGNGQGLSGGFGNTYTLADPLITAQYLDDDYGIVGISNGESPLSYAEWLLSGPPTPANPNGTRPATGLWRPQQAYYVTYFSPSHEEEAAAEIGSYRKIYEYLQEYVIGIGNFYVIPLRDRLGNSANRPPGPRTLSFDADHDQEWKLSVSAQRLALLHFAQGGEIIPSVVSITISPTTASVSVNGTQDFIYTLNGTPTLDVVWSTSGGSVTQSGVYTAPNAAGNYTVTVTSVDDPSASASATVAVAALPAISFLASTEAANGINSTTGTSGGNPTINTTGATAIFALIRSKDLAPTMADSASNTWSYLTAGTGTDSNCRVAYVFNPTTSATHTFTPSGTDVAADIFAFTTTGGSWSFDTQNASTSVQSGTVVTTGTVTPSVIGEVIIAGITSNGSVVTGTVNNGFSGGITGQPTDVAMPQNFNDSPEVGVGAYLIDPADAAISATFSVTEPNGDWAWCVAAFKVS
jgi:hypothetical protein